MERAKASNSEYVLPGALRVNGSNLIKFGSNFNGPPFCVYQIDAENSAGSNVPNFYWSLLGYFSTLQFNHSIQCMTSDSRTKT